MTHQENCGSFVYLKALSLAAKSWSSSLQHFHDACHLNRSSLHACVMIARLTFRSEDEADVQEQHAQASTSHSLDMSSACHIRMAGLHPAMPAQCKS